MNEDPLQIPGRIKELREIMEISAMDIAADIHVPLATYEKYESGEQDIPISVLYNIANRLGTDVTVLMTGEDPRMNSAAVCRRGKGVQLSVTLVMNFPALRITSRAELWNRCWCRWIRPGLRRRRCHIPDRNLTT